MLVRAFLGRHRSLARVRAADHRPVSKLLLGRRGHGDPGDRERFRPRSSARASRGRVESGPILPGAEYGHFAKKRLTLS